MIIQKQKTNYKNTLIFLFILAAVVAGVILAKNRFFVTGEFDAAQAAATVERRDLTVSASESPKPIPSLAIAGPVKKSKKGLKLS